MMPVNLQPFTTASGPDADDDVARAVELKRGDISVFTIPDEQEGLTLELLNASFDGKVESAKLRCLYISARGVRCWIERLRIEYAVERVDSRTSSLLRVAGSNTFVCEPFMIEWSYSSRNSVWLYPAAKTEYAVAKAEQYPAPKSAIRRFFNSLPSLRHR
ncbi:MAG: hypothetical protein EA381_19610 [Planctomycetaceae bacterium]|nr:MAG: hypothetical protein EA381_19610 [Planctomycetaceae bacterium]